MKLKIKFVRVVTNINFFFENAFQYKKSVNKKGGCDARILYISQLLNMSDRMLIGVNENNIIIINIIKTFCW